jgi:uncharacterized protein YndB with AHSA1/START domain
MANIYHHFVINTPATKVYGAVSTLDGLRNWWTKDTTGNPNKNGEIRFGFGENIFNKMKVTNVEKNKLITWNCIEGHPDWVGTNLSFQLLEEKGNTIVKFRHNDWKEENDFFGSCNFHWAFYMQSLKALCETGEGKPYKV